MTQLTQLIVQGIPAGAIYGLVALGLVLSYKATEVLNFAQGDVVMLSAFLGWGLVVAAGLPFWLSFFIVLGIAAALCFLLEAKVSMTPENWGRKYAQQHRLPFTDYASLLHLPAITSLIAAQVEIANGRLAENHPVRTIRVIPRSLHPGDEELARSVLTEPTGV